MGERQGIVDHAGRPVTLLGEEIRTGDFAPETLFEDHRKSKINLNDLQGKIVILASSPGLTTDVSQAVAKRLDSAFATLPDDVVTATVSLDPPETLRDVRDRAGIERLETWSDRLDGSFGMKWGIRIKERPILARAAFVINRMGILHYARITPDTTVEPAYDEFFTAVRILLDD